MRIFLKHKPLDVCNTIWRCIVKQNCLDKRRQNTFTHTKGNKHEASDNRIACPAQQNTDGNTPSKETGNASHCAVRSLDSYGPPIFLAFVIPQVLIYVLQSIRSFGPSNGDGYEWIWKVRQEASERLLHRVDVEAIQLLDKSELVRRFKRKKKPFELVQWSLKAEHSEVRHKHYFLYVLVTVH